MTATVIEGQVSPKHQKAAEAQTAAPVPHPFELKSTGVGSSESVFEASALRAAEKAQHEEIVRAARLKKCKKRQAVKHCGSGTWGRRSYCN